MSRLYGGHTNVIYEVCNEPNGDVTWEQVKAYAEKIIGVIRANDAENLILVGSPTWSQRVDLAAADPITGYENILYTLHFYAATHKAPLRLVLERAVGAGLPVFVSEFGIHGSPTCELTYKNAKAELCGSTRLGLIKYVMALMNGARLGIGAQSTGLSQEAYNEAVKYAAARAQFGKTIEHFPGVYDMLSRMKAKLDASRALLYHTAAHVDIYKCLEDIQRDRPLTGEERSEMKRFSRLADAYTPLCKGMSSEYANQNAYDCVSVHGGSGFIMEYKCQRLMRDARIFSIYEGTTQLQVVAAIRYITNGTYLEIMKDLLGGEVSARMAALRDRVASLVPVYEESIEAVKAFGNQEVQDFLARRLYDMTGEIVMALLLVRDASRAPELFTRSAHVMVRMAEETVAGKSAYIKNFRAEDLAAFRAVEA